MDSEAEVPIPLPKQLEELKEIPKLVVRHNWEAERAKSGRCREGGEVYEIILPGPTGDGEDEDEEEVAGTVLFNGISDRSTTCCIGGSASTVILFHKNDEDTHEVEIVKIKFESIGSICPEFPKRVRLYSPTSQLIGFVKINKLHLIQGNPTFDICNVDQKIVYRATAEATRSFQFLEYSIFDSNERSIGTVKETGQFQFTLGITDSGVNTLNRARLLGFTFAIEFLRKWQFKNN